MKLAQNSDLNMENIFLIDISNATQINIEYCTF